MPAGELPRKRTLGDCTPDLLRKCFHLCINSSVDIRVAHPGFIGSIKVPESLQIKLSWVCQGHLSNVRELAQNRPAHLYSITVYGHLRQPLFSSMVSLDTSLGPHGAKDLAFLSFSGYGEVTCQKRHSYEGQRALSKGVNELQNLVRQDNSFWSFSLQTVPAAYPYNFLTDVNHDHSISPVHYGEQPLL